MHHYLGCMTYFYSILSCELQYELSDDYGIFTTYFTKKLKCAIISYVQGRSMFFNALKLVTYCWLAAEHDHNFGESQDDSRLSKIQ